MATFQELKRLAEAQTAESQAALALERSAREREREAKRLATEQREREEKQRERKLMAARIAARAQEEKEARARAEHAIREAEDGFDPDLDELGRASAAANETFEERAKRKAAVRANLDRVAPPSAKQSRQPGQPRRKQKSGTEDDFTNSRVERMSARAGPSRVGSAVGKAGSRASRESIPLTREEKRQRKLAALFGANERVARTNSPLSTPREMPPRSSPSAHRSGPVPERNGASKSSAVRGRGSGGNELVALGTTRRDLRSIDEIERDLQRRKSGSNPKGPIVEGDREREDAMERRRRAMEEKREKDALEAEARRMTEAQGSKADEGENGSGSESGRDRLAPKGKDRRDGPANSLGKPIPSRSTSHDRRLGRADSPDTRSPRVSGHASGPSSRGSPLPSVSRHDRKTDASRASGVGSGHVNPADYLPGAPARFAALESIPKRLYSVPREAEPEPKRLKVKHADVAKLSPPSKPSPPPTAKRETERDRFLRREQEKKARRATAASGTPSTSRTSGVARAHQSRRRASEDEDDSDQGDGYEDEEESGDDMDVREEIWKLFGKDRKTYASRAVESDDDMEADAESVYREEMRSARQAREEDLREEEEERRREREKAARKRAAELAGR